MDNSPFTVHTRQLRAARALLEWNAQQLAEEAEVGVATIRRLESKDGNVKRLTIESYEKILRAFRDAKIEFINEETQIQGKRYRRWGVSITEEISPKPVFPDLDDDIPF